MNLFPDVCREWLRLLVGEFRKGEKVGLVIAGYRRGYYENGEVQGGSNVTRYVRADKT